MSDEEDEIIAKVSDYVEGTLEGPEKEVVAKKIADDPAWKRVHDEMVETREAISGLQKAHAPPTFAEDVTSTIHKRSAGRFFAKRTFGDRVPFGVLLVVALVMLVAIAGVLWMSQTGSLKVRNETTHEHGSAVVP